MDFSFVFDLFSLVHVPTWLGLLFIVVVPVCFIIWFSSFPFLLVSWCSSFVL